MDYSWVEPVVGLVLTGALVGFGFAAAWFNAKKHFDK